MPFSTSSEFLVALVLITVELVGALSSGAGATCLHGAQQQSSNPISRLGQRTITRWSSGQPETSVQRDGELLNVPLDVKVGEREFMQQFNGWTGDRNRFEIERTVFRLRQTDSQVRRGPPELYTTPSLRTAPHPRPLHVTPGTF